MQDHLSGDNHSSSKLKLVKSTKTFIVVNRTTDVLHLYDSFSGLVAHGLIICVVREKVLFNEILYYSFSIIICCHGAVHLLANVRYRVHIIYV